MQDRGGGRGGRGRGRGGIAPGMRPVSEESRISIADQVEKFRESTDTGTGARVAVTVAFMDLVLEDGIPSGDWHAFKREAAPVESSPSLKKVEST